MANINAAFGLRPVSTLSGAPYNGQARKYYMAATYGTATYIGTPVKLAGSGDTLGQYATVENAATGDYIVGVVVGFDPVEGVTTPPGTPYRAASTARYVYVADDPDLVFEIQEVSGGTALTAAEIGLNADFVVTTVGNTSTALSGVELNNIGEATTAEDLRILGVSSKAGNALGENCVWLVRINLHQHRYTTGV